MILVAPPADLSSRRAVAEMLRQRAAAMPDGWGRERYEAYAAELEAELRAAGVLSRPASR
jgi:hypothetical protein